MKKIVLYVLTILIFSITTTSCFADMVVFNTKTKIIHSLNCPSAKKCTVNCIKIERSEAIKRGGVICKTCNAR